MDYLKKYMRENQETLAHTLCRNLKNRGYWAQYVSDEGAAVHVVKELIPEEATVGIPGSVTVRQLGLIDILETRGNTVFHHWDPGLKYEDRNQRFLDENTSDWFLTSSNAITLSGDLVNIDGTGNRVAAMAWGPGKILYIIGINKICHDLESAIARVRDVATPPNSRRINGNTPCVKVGYCVDCNVTERICRIVSIMERPPLGRECHILLVGAELGY